MCLVNRISINKLDAVAYKVMRKIKDSSGKICYVPIFGASIEDIRKFYPYHTYNALSKLNGFCAFINPESAWSLFQNLYKSIFWNLRPDYCLQGPLVVVKVKLVHRLKTGNMLEYDYDCIQGHFLTIMEYK